MGQEDLTWEGPDWPLNMEEGGHEPRVHVGCKLRMALSLQPARKRGDRHPSTAKN